MARKSTSSVRPDTHDTAAYAASQPLFDSLRSAIESLDKQKANLVKARDIVQQLHVKLPNGHVDNNDLLHENYMDGLFEAWSSATEAYGSVFEQLCAINGPDPATGREAQEGYEGYSNMLDLITRANGVAVGCLGWLKKEAVGTSEVDAAQAGQSPSSKQKKKHIKSEEPPIETAATPSAPISAKRTALADPSPAQETPRPNKKQRTIPIQQTPVASNRPIKKPKSQGPRQQRKAKQREQLQTPLPPTSTSAAATPPTLQPVAYADVSAEVDARLAAKRAKKEAKKRKRESNGSGIVEAEVGKEDEAVEAHERKLAEKPAKKRSKGETGEAVRVGGDGVDKQGKRESEGGGDSGEKKKKRKKR